MKILKSLEKFFESSLEGTSSALFRQPLKPVEIEERLQQAMLEQSEPSHQGRLTPDTFDVTLSPQSYEASIGRIASFNRSCESYLRSVADENNLILINPVVTVNFSSDDSLGLRDIRIHAQFTQRAATAARPSRAAPNDFDRENATRVFTSAGWYLEVLNGDQAGQRFVVPEGVVNIGRGSDNDIAVPDAGKTVSRRHAVLERECDTITIRDVGSTNGTKVNGHSVAYARIGNGAHIALGDCHIRIGRED